MILLNLILRQTCHLIDCFVAHNLVLYLLLHSMREYLYLLSVPEYSLVKDSQEVYDNRHKQLYRLLLPDEMPVAHVDAFPSFL